MKNNKISYAARSDVGRQRENNEDAYLLSTIWNDNTILAVVIDGVGGYEGGERAAALAQEKIVEYLENYPNGERAGLLKRAVVYANNAIYKERAQEPQYSRMSCVLTAVIVDYTCRTIFMAHVGDTRLYSYTDGMLVKLSHDHSFVGYREEVGDLTEMEAMNHPERNVISRDVGSQPLQNSDDKYIEVATFALAPHTTLLLCSDGLCDMITSVQMKEILCQDLSVNDKAQALVTAANEAGGRDNITVVLVETEYEDVQPVQPTEVVVDVVEDTPVEKIVTEEENHIPQVPIAEYELLQKRYRRWKLWAITSWMAMLVIGVIAFIFCNKHTLSQASCEQHDMVIVCDSLPCDTVSVISADTVGNIVLPPDSVID